MRQELPSLPVRQTFNQSMAATLRLLHTRNRVSLDQAHQRPHRRPADERAGEVD